MSFHLFKTVSSGKDLTIVIGCGRLGAAIASMISDNGQDVTVIDSNEQAFRRLSLSFGGLTAVGNAVDLDVLNEAHMDEADTVIVVTSHDNVNIMAAEMAKSLFHVKNILVRLGDPDKKILLDSSSFFCISPFELAAKKIEQLLDQKAGDHPASPEIRAKDDADKKVPSNKERSKGE